MLTVELSQKSVEELLKIEEESRAELFALRFQASIGNLEKPHRVKELKIVIARILTILSNKEKVSGSKINRHVKVDLSKTFKNIEKDTKKLIKKRQEMAEKMMQEQQNKQNIDNNLFDNSLFDTGNDILEENKTSNQNILEVKNNKEISKETKKSDVKETSKKVSEEVKASKETKKADVKETSKTTTKKVSKEVKASKETKKADVKKTSKTTTKKVSEEVKASKETKKADVKETSKTSSKKVSEEVKASKEIKKSDVKETTQKINNNNLSPFIELSHLLSIPLISKLEKFKKDSNYNHLKISDLKSCYSKIFVPSNEDLANSQENEISKKLADHFSEKEVKEFLEIIKNKEIK